MPHEKVQWGRYPGVRVPCGDMTGPDPDALERMT